MTEMKMDITFKSGDEKFNYRVCAMIISEGNIRLKLIWE